MPSRAYTSFLQRMAFGQWKSRVESVNALSGLYLISTYTEEDREAILSYCVNALSGLYLISTVPLQKPRFYAVSRACFCRYLSEYSGSSRCHLIFSLSL